MNIKMNNIKVYEKKLKEHLDSKGEHYTLATMKQDTEKHIDYFKGCYSYQDKACYQISRTGNFFFQYESEYGGERDTGKITRCEAEFLIYRDVINKIEYKFRVKYLQEKDVWKKIKSFPLNPVPPDKNDGKVYWGHCVPKTEFHKVGDCWEFKTKEAIVRVAGKAKWRV